MDGRPNLKIKAVFSNFSHVRSVAGFLGRCVDIQICKANPNTSFYQKVHTPTRSQTIVKEEKLFTTCSTMSFCTDSTELHGKKVIKLN